MPECQNCHQKWSWSATFKRTSWGFFKEMECPHCGVGQYVTKSTRIRNALILGLLAGIASFIFGQFNLTILEVVLLYVITFGLASLLLPFGVRLSNKHESLSGKSEA